LNPRVPSNSPKMRAHRLAFLDGLARHLLHPRTPWLFFDRDHPLRRDIYRQKRFRIYEDFWEDEKEMLELLGDDEFDDSDDPPRARLT
jgi:hypothetical protein